MVYGSLKSLESSTEDFPVVDKLKQLTITEINSKWKLEDLDSTSLLVLSTALDPRFSAWGLAHQLSGKKRIYNANSVKNLCLAQRIPLLIVTKTELPIQISSRNTSKIATTHTSHINTSREEFS